MADENILLNVAGLSAAVDEKVILHDVDLTVGAGETHVLMGPNGAGKSTLGHAGLFLSFQAPVEIPGVPVSSFLRAISAGRPGVGDMKGKQFRKHVRELAEELNMDPAYLDRELGVGFSGGEKKKLEMLQLLLLEPKLAFLDETDSGLDVDALSVVSRGMEVYRKRCNGTLVIITHNTRILEHVDVNRVHVLVKGRMTAEGDASMIADIDENGFEQFEQAAAAAAE